MLRGMPALTDNELYAHGDPHAVWDVLRRECPVYRHDEPGHPPAFWAVTTYEPTLEVLTDWRRFSSARGTILRPDLEVPYPGAGTMLALSDPPRHDALRRAVSGLFSRRGVAQFAEPAGKVAGELLRRGLEMGTFDFVAEVAARIPLTVAGDLLGVEPDAVDLIRTATDIAAEKATDLDGAEAQAAHVEIMAYYAEVVERRRREPRRDLPSALVAAQRDGLDITDDEIILTCDNVILAATETTRLAIGTGVLGLIEHPGEWAALAGGEVAPADAADEILRWASPATHIMRTALCDTVLGDARIRAGDAVAVWLPSADRDESVFDGGDKFVLGRRPNRHLAFGGGVHFCLGAALSRLIIAALLRETVALVAEFSLAGPPRRLPSYILGGLSSLPVTVRPR